MALQKRKQKIRILQLVGVLLLAQIIALPLVTKLIYDSAFPRYDVPENAAANHAALDALKESTSFSCGDNTLQGWLYDSQGSSLVVMVQGINSHVGNFYPLIEKTISQDLRDVFIFDTTGSCASQGKSAVGFSQTVYDLNAALDHIAERYDYETIFLLGHSRGGYAACCVVSQRQDVDGVIAIGSPNSAMEAVIGPVADRIGFLAYGNYPMLWLYQAMLFDPETVSRTAAETITESSVPVLVIHADGDNTVPPDRYSIYSYRREITCDHAEFLLLEGDHSSLLADVALMDAVDSFLDRIAP